MTIEQPPALLGKPVLEEYVGQSGTVVATGWASGLYSVLLSASTDPVQFPWEALKADEDGHHNLEAGIEMTPLIFAVRMGNVDVVEALLADVKDFDMCDIVGRPIDCVLFSKYLGKQFFVGKTFSLRKNKNVCFSSFVFLSF